MSKFHVEYFKEQLGMCGHHDKNTYLTLEEASARMHALSRMNEEALRKELEVDFTPWFFRVLEVMTPS